ncbi:cytochrome c [Pseudomonas sp. Z1-14]
MNSCVSCHGVKLEGGVGPALAGGEGTLTTDKPLKTVGSYWPYATTLFDYIRRAMPFQAPQSLSNEQVYAVTGLASRGRRPLRIVGLRQHRQYHVGAFVHRLRPVHDPRPGTSMCSSARVYVT